ncbi:B12-binding domain-containing radical SAM protein, partial [Chlamydiota bacterium]
MKVLLINPPSENEIIGNNPQIIEEERGFNPPLGLLYIAAYLEKWSDHEVVVIDAQVENLSYENLAFKVKEINPDVVGITAMTLTLVDVLETVNCIKYFDKNITVVLGGPHVHLFPEETISFENVDFLVLGEGEKTFKELLENISCKEKLKKVKGLVFKDHGQNINTGFPELIYDLDEIPFPARHLVPYKKYNSLLAQGSVATTIFTSRGCPFNCSFCARPHLGNMFRAQSYTRVVDEIENCINMGIKDFLFYDDTFTIDKKRVINICKEIIKRKLDIRWDIRARVDTITEEMLKCLKEANCQGIHYGVEAGTEEMLKVLKKGITLKKVDEIFTLTRKYNIPILAYFMIGNPGETLEDMHETFTVMKKLRPDYVHITILTPFPGTEIYNHALEKGIYQEDYWREFSRNPQSNFEPPYW